MEFQKDGRFSFSEIHRYLSAGIYPDDFSKPDKQALRKRAKFFRAKNTALYYVGGHKGDSEPSTERLVAPEEMFFDVQQMRDHLCFCLSLRKMTPFPSKKRKIKNKDKRRNEAVAVFCKCRLLESAKMVCCDTCNKWYHDTCVVVPEQVWTMNSSVLWTCDACTL